FTAQPYAKFESLFGFQEYGDSSQSLPMTMKKLSATFNSGLIENKYMFYGHLGKIHSNGYRTQSAMDMGAYFFGALMLSDNMTTRVHFFGGPLEDQLVYNGLSKSVNSDKKLRRQNLTGYPDDKTGDFIYTNARRPQEKEAFNQPHYEILNEWKISDKQKINNTVFFYDSHGYYDYDASWADTSMLRINHSYGFNTTQNITNGIVRGAVDLYQWGWLPRYELQHENGELTIGAEYRYHKGTHWGRLAYGEGLPSNYDPDYRIYQYDGIKHMASLYATEIYHPQVDVSVMANVQLAYNEYKIENERFLNHSLSVPYYFLNPRLGINYNVTDEWNTYFSFGYTSREPRLRNLYAAEDAYWDPGATPQFKILNQANGVIQYDYTSPLVKPEQLLDLELGTGYKTSMMAGTVNVYWMEFTHELVKSGQIDIFGSPIYGNADRTRHIGFELDGTVRLPYSLLFSGNISLSSNKIIKLTTVIKDSTSGSTTYTHQQKLDGNPIAGFPDMMGNIRFGYQDDALSAFLSIKYVGEFYTDNFKNAANKNDAYTLINFESLFKLPTIAGTEISIRAEVRNVFNTLYTQTGEGNQFYPAAERNYLIGLTMKL
ncbi:MAG: TonB-dependent receptor, partial [Bacteroidota bacterium]|nr:TonB-dependent receptor [Bacteroidota bacterium]